MALRPAPGRTPPRGIVRPSFLLISTPNHSASRSVPVCQPAKWLQIIGRLLLVAGRQWHHRSSLCNVSGVQWTRDAWVTGTFAWRHGRSMRPGDAFCQALAPCRSVGWCRKNGTRRYRGRLAWGFGPAERVGSVEQVLDITTNRRHRTPAENMTCRRPLPHCRWALGQVPTPAAPQHEHEKTDRHGHRRVGPSPPWARSA